jgi:O-antigen/teichoic acid export membrane protein
LFKNIISSFFAKSIVAFTLLAILLISSQQLGAGVVGQVSLLILNLAIIQAISDVYTGTALVYFIPKYAFRKIYVNGLVWTLICMIILNLLFYYLNVGVKELWFHVLVLSFISTLQAFHNVVLLAKEKIRMYTFLVAFQPAALLIVLCFNIFILNIKDISAYIIAMYVSWISSFILSTIRIIGILSSDEKTTENIDSISILRNGFVNQLGNLAHILSNRFNYYMLERGSLLLVGVYASATSLIESVWIISGSISPIILTHIANQNDESNNSRITLLLSKICFLLSAACVLVVFILPVDFFTFLLGKDFAGTKTVMMYLSPGVLCLSFSSIISHYYSGLGRQRILLIANSSGLIVTLCTSYYFVSMYGMFGACYAATLSYATQALVLTVVFMKQSNFTIGNLFSLKKDVALLRK